MDSAQSDTKLLERVTKDGKNALYHFELHKRIEEGSSVFTVALNRYVPNAHQDDIRFFQLFEHPILKKQVLLTGSYDKNIKIWEIAPQTFNCLFTHKHSKKVDGGIIPTDSSRFIFPDKTGDVFELEFLQTGFSDSREIHTGIATFVHFQLVSLPKTSSLPNFVIAADDYNKIISFRYPEMYEILSILAPYKEIYAQLIDFYPHGVIGLHFNGVVDIIEYSSFINADFKVQSHDFKKHFEGKKAYGIEKISDNSFLIIDDYFTVAVSVHIDSTTKQIQEKKFNLRRYGLVDNIQKYKEYKNFYVVKDEKDYILVTETFPESEATTIEVQKVDESFTRISLKNIQIGVYKLGEPDQAAAP